MPNCCAPWRVDRALHSFCGRLRVPTSALVLSVFVAAGGFPLRDAAAQTPATPQVDQTPDPVKEMVQRLDLQKYKATIKGLTQFGDRQQGTDRNRAAVDWIESQLKSFGCTSTERIRYEYQPPATPRRRPARRAAARERAAASCSATGCRPASTGIAAKQPDPKLRELNAQPSTPGPREEVFCTKVGAVHPDEMYIVGAHMDGLGFGEAANDDGSGTALVMELARVLSSPDVRTERSIRFALWNNEETGLDGAAAYVAQRRELQGQEQPAGSGKYPEPRWLGMIQHDMMMFDHGMPSPDGRISAEPARRGRREHRVPRDIEDGGRRAEAGVGAQGGERGVRGRLSRSGRAAHDEHRFGAVHEPRCLGEREGERTRCADRRWMGPALAPADRSLLDRSPTRTSSSDSMQRRPRLERSGASPGPVSPDSR